MSTLGLGGRARRTLHLFDEYLEKSAPRPLYTSALRAARTGRRLIGRNPARGRLRPDFVIIGAAKSGTTSLYEWLEEHPYVVGASRKEVDFFSYRYYRGTEWYLRNFPFERERTAFRETHGQPFLTGEGSPSYMQHRLAPGRMAKLVPDAKLIVSLRDPVDRAYSGYQMWRRWRGEPVDSFMTAVALEEPRIDGGEALAKARENGQHDIVNFRVYNDKDHLGRQYLMGSRYVEQLERWFQFYPRERFHISTTEELAADPNASFSRLQEFLGLPSHDAKLEPRFVGNYDPLPAADRERLREYFRPYNERLYELLGRDFGW